MHPLRPIGTEATGAGSVPRVGWALAKLAWWAFGWGTAAGLAVVAIAWTAGHAPRPEWKWLHAFTFYLYLPAYLLAGVSAWARRYRLALAAGVICVWHLAIVLPTVAPWSAPGHGRLRPGAAAGAPPPTPGASRLTVFYANIAAGNGHRDALFDEIRDSDADVLLLTELSASWHNAFNGTELAVKYPEHVHLGRYDRAATGLFSQYPVVQSDRWYQGRRVVLQAEIAAGPAGGGRQPATLDVLAIHAPRPVRSPLHRAGPFWQMTREVLADRDPARPLLLIGDFNATPYSVIYRRLVDGHALTDCHRATGRGWATTWPNGRGWLPPIRIDHALISGAVSCESIYEGVGTGSDHKPLVITLRIAPNTRAGETPPQPPDAGNAAPVSPARAL